MRPVLTLLWQEADDDWPIPDDEDGTVGIALRVMRSAFPDIYVQAVDLLRQGGDYADLDRLICGEIAERGIPLDDLQWIGYGIPLPAYGAELENPDFYTAHPDLIPILACFGVSPEPNPYHIDLPDCIYTAGRFIAADLEDHTHERYRQVARLMGWLFSRSGNSIVDWDYEMMAECQPLSWDADDLDFARAMIEEADELIRDGFAGLDFINAQSEFVQALQRNVQRIYKALERRKGKESKLRLRLKWPNLHDAVSITGLNETVAAEVQDIQI